MGKREQEKRHNETHKEARLTRDAARYISIQLFRSNKSLPNSAGATDKQNKSKMT